MLRGLFDIYQGVARRRSVPTPVAEARLIRKIRQWDDRIVAPRYGFRDAEHYYRSVSVAPRLSQITIPTLIVYARRQEGRGRLVTDSCARTAPFDAGSEDLQKLGAGKQHAAKAT